MRFLNKFRVLIPSVLLIAACSAVTKEGISKIYSYKPDSQELHDKILRLDSLFFHAYNTCDIKTQSDFYADSIEFYHDQTGLSTSKKDLLEATKKNICGKVSRELIKESIEVYPLKGFGAIEIGLHRFRNNTEKREAPADPGKFIIIWKQNGDSWKITRVVSLH